ncbi:MAG: 6,7-dimethyl-8-ribityllumazine synthase [Bacteroidales bacterium]|jgi:6,7-dimethyl-8-ribityllumazine synthase|nr:6,7-dimethyl-8-ribityllumazine synthase [Bacteroidales bacterium]
MSTENFSLTAVQTETELDTEGMRIGIVVSQWNSEITRALEAGAVQTLEKYGMSKDDIVVRYVPGSFELTVGALLMTEYVDMDAVICLGCVIQGETPHFDYICRGVSFGLTKIAAETGIPIIFGVLTTLNKEQALERAGGIHGNKGEEAALTAIRMITLKWDMMDEAAGIKKKQKLEKQKLEKQKLEEQQIEE